MEFDFKNQGKIRNKWICGSTFLSDAEQLLFYVDVLKNLDDILL